MSEDREEGRFNEFAAIGLLVREHPQTSFGLLGCFADDGDVSKGAKCL